MTPARMLWLLLALAVAGFAAFWWLAAHWAPPRDRYPVQGIVVDAANGPVDWPTVRAQAVDFAYLQATAGDAERDPDFARNWAEAARTGLRYGAVHRYSLCRLAGDQARLFIANVPRDNAALPPVVALDFDAGCTARPSRDVVLSELNTLLNEIEAHSGKPVILRLSKPFERAYAISEGINRTVWLNGNVVPPDYAAHVWVLWTANDWRQVPGVEGRVGWTVVRP